MIHMRFCKLLKIDRLCPVTTQIQSRRLFQTTRSVHDNRSDELQRKKMQYKIVNMPCKIEKKHRKTEAENYREQAC